MSQWWKKKLYGLSTEAIITLGPFMGQHYLLITCKTIQSSSTRWQKVRLHDRWQYLIFLFVSMLWGFPMQNMWLVSMKQAKSETSPKEPKQKANLQMAVPASEGQSHHRSWRPAFRAWWRVAAGRGGSAPETRPVWTAVPAGRRPDPRPDFFARNAGRSASWCAPHLFGEQLPVNC